MAKKCHVCKTVTKEVAEWICENGHVCEDCWTKFWKGQLPMTCFVCNKDLGGYFTGIDGIVNVCCRDCAEAAMPLKKCTAL